MDTSDGPAEPQALTTAGGGRPDACPRCGGRFLKPGSDGDRACFACGFVDYLLSPMPLTPHRRRPSSGGLSLD